MGEPGVARARLDAVRACPPVLRLVRGDEGGRPDEAAGASPSSAAEPPPTPGSRPAPVILVADDEPAMRLLVQVNLEFAGFGVDLAENGLQAIQKAEAGGHDLLLLDVMMPDLSGHEVARRLRRLAGAPPIVFLSARASREDRRQGYALGAFDYIEKPFDPLEIGGRVQRVLDRVREGTAETARLERLAELGG